MFLNFSLLFQIGLLVAGIYWCKEVLGRLREDMVLVGDKAIEGTRKGVVVGVWVLTAVIAGVMALYVGGVVINLVRAFH